MDEMTVYTQKDVLQAAHALNKGKLVAFPTETVYGLGAPVFDVSAIQSIFEVKGRPQDNPLIVHISSLDQLPLIAKNIPETFYRLANRWFPGPLTLVVEKKESVPSLVSGGLPTIGIRMPAHSLARELIEKTGQPLVAPSANLSGKPSATCVKHVLEDFDGKIAGVIDGGHCQVGLESTVLDLVTFDTPTILRPGAVTKEELINTLGAEIATYTTGPKSSPGMRYRHYAPETPVFISQSREACAQRCIEDANTLVLSNVPIKEDQLSLEAASLYFYLRLADEKQVSSVVICTAGCEDVAVLNRLEKIASHSSSLSPESHAQIPKQKQTL